MRGSLVSEGVSAAKGPAVWQKMSGGAACPTGRLRAVDVQRFEVLLADQHLLAQVGAREIAEAYRTAVLPQRESIVSSTQEEHNFMLVGVFELLQARRSQLDAYQSYVEAVRDYWLARTDLRKSVGGALPGESPADTDAPMPEPLGEAQ